MTGWRVLSGFASRVSPVRVRSAPQTDSQVRGHKFLSQSAPNNRWANWGSLCAQRGVLLTALVRNHYQPSTARAPVVLAALDPFHARSGR